MRTNCIRWFQASLLGGNFFSASLQLTTLGVKWQLHFKAENWQKKWVLFCFLKLWRYHLFFFLQKVPAYQIFIFHGDAAQCCSGSSGKAMMLKKPFHALTKQQPHFAMSQKRAPHSVGTLDGANAAANANPQQNCSEGVIKEDMRKT